jgi:acetyl-CoA decarbonylase/synthase complex subunit beta
MDPTISALLQALPDAYAPFGGSEYPMPVAQALLGAVPDLARLRAWLVVAGEGEVKNRCEPVAVAAEVIESRAADRERYFMDDGQVRSVVFMGAKWRAGWVLLAGDAITQGLVERLKAAGHMIFSAQYEALRDQALPARETGAVYFLQLMVRYAMIWGQIPAGEDHEMGHFLEQDMPGALVVRGALGPLEGLVLLALMKMGCPAVVDPGFPYEVGPRSVGRTEDEVLIALGEFPNMRVRIVAGQEFALPEGAATAYLRESFASQRVVNGLFQLRPGNVEPCITVVGDQADSNMAVIVEVTDPKLDLPVSAHLEAEAVSFGSYLQGVKTSRANDGSFRVELAEPGALDGNLLGRVISAGLRRKYPRLGAMRVRVEFGTGAVERERPAAAEFDRLRDEAILAESEQTVDEFHLCIDCQPFSHAHVCVITPDRPPMCGRNRNEIKAGALWGADYRPWTRRIIGGEDLQFTIPKGEPIDAAAGEWANLNAAVRELTGGRLERVRIHAVCDVPHTSCGCFGALAFKLPDMDGIGVVDRSYKGSVPGELSWSILANRAGGKQAPGVTGITLDYLRSPKALAAEGGLGAVKWATKRVLAIMEPYLPPGSRVATEDKATTSAELAVFLASGETG